MTKTMPRQRHFLASCYRSCLGNWDHYIPFVERALDLADSNGTICLLTPTKWLSIPYGRGLRGLTRTSFAALLDFSHYRAFEHVGVAAIGNLFRKNSNGLRVTRYSATGRPDLKVTVDRKLLSQHNWGALSSPNLQLLIDNFTTGQTLKDLAMAEESFTVSEAYELKPLVVEQLKTVRKYFALLLLFGRSLSMLVGSTADSLSLGAKFDRPVVDALNLSRLMPRTKPQARSAKIILSGMRYFEAFVDANGSCLASKSTIILRPYSSKLSLWGLAAFLNSKPTRFYIQESYSALAVDGGIDFSPSLVNEFPLPKGAEELFV